MTTFATALHSPIENAFLLRWAHRRGMSLPLHAQPLTSGCLLYHNFRQVPRNANCFEASSARSRCSHSMSDLALTDDDLVTFKTGRDGLERIDTWKLRSDIGSGGSLGTCGVEKWVESGHRRWHRHAAARVHKKAGKTFMHNLRTGHAFRNTLHACEWIGSARASTVGLHEPTSSG